MQRFADGTYVERDCAWATMYLEHSPINLMVHDLENIGDSRLRFVTVDLD